MNTKILFEYHIKEVYHVHVHVKYFWLSTLIFLLQYQYRMLKKSNPQNDLLKIYYMHICFLNLVENVDKLLLETLMYYNGMR